MLSNYFLCVVVFTSAADSIRLECEFHVSANLPTVFEVKQGLVDAGSVSEDGSRQVCHHLFGQCAALWSFDPDTNDTTVLLKGCWKGNAECERSECVASETISHRYLNNSRFCCCSSFQCNSNVSYVPVARRVANYLPKFLTPNTATTDESGNATVALTVVICVAFAAVAFAVGVAIYWFLFRRWSRFRGKNGENLEKNLLISSTTDGDKSCSLLLGNGGGSNNLSSTTDVAFSGAERLALSDVIGRGRYSLVRKARLVLNVVADDRNEIDRLGDDEREFAVKIYEASNKSYFFNERNLFSLTLLKHENVVKFYGAHDCATAGVFSAEEVAPSSGDYWLIMEYMPSGTLQDYLKANTFDFHSMCKIALSVARGLAFLHMEIRKNGVVKPAIVHRDVNSRNVLMKADGSCVICDLGFAMSLESTKLNSSSDEVCLTEVGTVRYMAPEVLEGAVNLRDPETSLKQVDVYALGLVIWETISRCYDIAGATCPEYSAPYAREASNGHPTLEQMQLLVCKKKVRPLFPGLIYKLMNAPLRDLRDMVEDCWDQDSEARITALCAQERLTELYEAVVVDHTGPKYVCPSNGRWDSSVVVDLNALNAARVNPRLFPNRSDRYNPDFQRPSPRFNESTADTGTTSGLGSMFMNTSSDRGRSFHSGSSFGYQRNASDQAGESGPLQPFQGLNPCLERNLHTAESSDSSSSGYGNRVTESNFDNKIDPCQADQLMKYAPGALFLAAGKKPPSEFVEKNHADARQQYFVDAEAQSALAMTSSAANNSNNADASEHLLARLLLKNRRRDERCPSSIKNDLVDARQAAPPSTASSRDVSPASTPSGGCVDSAYDEDDDEEDSASGRRRCDNNELASLNERRASLNLEKTLRPLSVANVNEASA